MIFERVPQEFTGKRVQMVNLYISEELLYLCDGGRTEMSMEVGGRRAELGSI